jgi:hypothetical protein
VALDPSCLLRGASPTVRQFGHTSPECERFLQPSNSSVDVTGHGGVASESGCRLVTRRIDLALGERPPRSLGQVEAVTQRATQRGDMSLQRFGGGKWRVLTPQQFDKSIGGDDGAVIQPQHREDRARFGARDRDGSSVESDLRGPKPPSSTA